MVFGEQININTSGFSDIKDITQDVSRLVHKSGIQNGIVCVCAIGSTASVTTIEYEPALVEDFRDQLEAFAPHTMHSRHSQTWGDDNGFSHIRASFMGPSTSLAIRGGEILLGTWQQIIVVDHDNRPRQRKVFVQVVGE